LGIRHIIALNEILWEKFRSNAIRMFWEDLFLFEAFNSIAKGARKHLFNFPRFTKSGLRFNGFFHPMVRNPVRNSLLLQEPVMLLTGPNMSGKSTLLKSIGLCVYLGHLGLPVPAESCELNFFDSISIIIHLEDDLANGYSHFMTEIKSLKEILMEARAGKRCFAIFDELFRSTNEEDALAISRTTIQGLTKLEGSQFLLSTHLHQLKDSIIKDPTKIARYCIECIIKDLSPVFTYKLESGWSDLKIGQMLFRQEGLDQLLSPKL
jgi:DNA mismatch repair protein MutS